jgi:hypothetical protein
MYSTQSTLFIQQHLLNYIIGGCISYHQSYQPVRQYICLQTAQCKVPQSRICQYHFIQLS